MRILDNGYPFLSETYIATCYNLTSPPFPPTTLAHSLPTAVSLHAAYFSGGFQVRIKFLNYNSPDFEIRTSCPSKYKSRCLTHYASQLQPKEARFESQPRE